MGPVVEVVDFADFVVGGAADAASVAGDELFAVPFGDFALGPSEQWGAGVFVEDAGQDFRVAGEGEGFGLGEACAVGEAGVGDGVVGLVVVGEDDQFGPGRCAGAGGGADQLGERVGESVAVRWGGLGVLACGTVPSDLAISAACTRAPVTGRTGQTAQHAVGLFLIEARPPAPLRSGAFGVPGCWCAR